jgi:hypothetical protein
VVHGVLDASGDGAGSLGITLFVYDAGRGRRVPVTGRAPFGPDMSTREMSDALASSVARPLIGALGGVAWGGTRADGGR